MPDKTSGLIFDIQDYAVKDGSGVRTLVFLKGCPLNCKWCSNPEGKHFYPELLYAKYRCQQCLNCVTACPVGAVKSGPEGYQVFNRSNCRTCENYDCTLECPHQAIRIAGRNVTPHELYERVKVNALLYRNSGGGVTLSGGEPFAQPEFVSDFLDECARIGLSVGVETCGMFDWSAIKPIIERFDFVYFDLKCLDSNLHKEYCGVNPDNIWKNLEHLSEHIRDRITVSVPIIPGVNADEAQFTKIVELCRMLGIQRIRLLPYHTLGTGKYEELGEGYRMKADLTVETGLMERLVFIGRMSELKCYME